MRKTAFAYQITTLAISISILLCLTHAGCAPGTGVGEITPTDEETTSADCLVVCADLDQETVDCDPPAQLCSVFPPQGSGLPVEHYVTVDEQHSFPCTRGSYDCYQAAEDYCDDHEDDDWDILPTAAPPTSTPPIPSQL